MLFIDRRNFLLCLGLATLPCLTDAESPTTVREWVSRIRSHDREAYLRQDDKKHADLASDLKALRDLIMGDPSIGRKGQPELVSVFQELLLDNPVVTPFMKVLIAEATPLASGGMVGAAKILGGALGKLGKLLANDDFEPVVVEVANGLKEGVLLGGENMQEAALHLVSIMSLARNRGLALPQVHHWEKLRWVNTNESALGIFQSKKLVETFRELNLEGGQLYLSFARAVAYNMDAFGWTLEKSTELTACELKKNLDRRVFPKPLGECTVVIITHAQKRGDSERIPFTQESGQLIQALKSAGVKVLHFQPKIDRDPKKNREPEDVVKEALEAIGNCVGPLMVVTNMHGQKHSLEVSHGVSFSQRSDDPSTSFYHALERHYHLNGSFDDLFIFTHSCFGFDFFTGVFKRGFRHTDESTEIVQNCRIPRPLIVSGAAPGCEILYPQAESGIFCVPTMIAALTELISTSNPPSELRIRDLMKQLESRSSVTENNDPHLILPSCDQEEGNKKNRYAQLPVLGL